MGCATTPRAIAAGAKVVSSSEGCRVSGLPVTRNGASEIVRVSIPAGSDALFITAAGSPGHLYGIDLLEDPAGKKVIERKPSAQRPFAGLTESPNRTDPGKELITAQIPNNPQVRLTPGEWKLRIAHHSPSGQPSGPVDLEVKVKPTQARGRLQVELLFPEGGKWSAREAPAHPELQRALEAVRSVYQRAQIEVTFSYRSIPASFRIIDMTARGNLGDSRKLSRKAGAVSVVVSEEIQAVLDNGQVGRAGNGTAPMSGPARPGTLQSGVNVAYGRIADAQKFGYVIGHEIGHYLGLYEIMDGWLVSDQLPDTFTYDTENLMSPQPEGSLGKLTPQQIAVLHRHPLVTPN